MGHELFGRPDSVLLQVVAELLWPCVGAVTVVPSSKKISAKPTSSSPHPPFYDRSTVQVGDDQVTLCGVPGFIHEVPRPRKQQSLCLIVSGLLWIGVVGPVADMPQMVGCERR